MELIKTGDKSTTFRHPEHLEPYHTRAGAIIEGFEKHARLQKVWEKENPVLFDVCSGLSYSAACALEEIRNHGNNSFVKIYLFENDFEILKKNLELEDAPTYLDGSSEKELKSYVHFKRAIKQFLETGKKEYSFENTKIIIVFGDVHETINFISENADFVFYAPFSPKITPEMWIPEIFIKLYNKMNSGGKLTTYSYARHVREGLQNAGFVIEDGPVIGRRSPSTIAIKK